MPDGASSHTSTSSPDLPTTDQELKQRFVIFLQTEIRHLEGDSDDSQGDYAPDNTPIIRRWRTAYADFI